MLPARVLGVATAELGRAMTTLSAPLFDMLIPTMKAGANLRMAEAYLRTHPTASEEVVARRMAQIVADVDNRFGEMNMNNLFWNKWFIHTANIATISTSWAYGTWNWTTRALQMTGRFDPIALQTLVGAAVIYAGLNGALSWAHTGQFPAGWDFVNARTSTGKRLLVPTEFKEYFDIGKILATVYAREGKGGADALFDAGREAALYPLAKENTMLSLLRGFLDGKDAIEHRIAYTPGGVVGWLKSEVWPVVLSNYEKTKDAGLTPAERLFIREAPTWVEDPAKFYKTQEGLVNRWTKEELGRARREGTAPAGPPREYKGKAPRGGGSHRGGGFSPSNPWGR
jgi:hypothetical protein